VQLRGVEPEPGTTFPPTPASASCHESPRALFAAKQGSRNARQRSRKVWCGAAEIEVSIFTRQCLGKRRIGSLRVRRAATAAWRARLDRRRLIIDWKFTVGDARRKLRYSRRGCGITLQGD